MYVIGADPTNKAISNLLYAQTLKSSSYKAKAPDDNIWCIQHLQKSHNTQAKSSKPKTQSSTGLTKQEARDITILT